MADRKDTWLTPKWVIEALGPFDLDPCAPSHDHWTAKECWTKEDDAFARAWPIAGNQRIFLNPPYNPLLPWMERMSYCQGIALVTPRTGSKWFHKYVLEIATAIFWVKGRIQFIDPDTMKEATAPRSDNSFIAYGMKDAAALMLVAEKGLIKGKFTWLKNQ